MYYVFCLGAPHPPSPVSFLFDFLFLTGLASKQVENDWQTSYIARVTSQEKINVPQGRYRQLQGNNEESVVCFYLFIFIFLWELKSILSLRTRLQYSSQWSSPYSCERQHLQEESLSFNYIFATFMCDAGNLSSSITGCAQKNNLHVTHAPLNLVWMQLLSNPMLLSFFFFFYQAGLVFLLK